MIRCESCRTLNEDNARVCTWCGTSLWLSGRTPTAEMNKPPAAPQAPPRPAYTPPSYTAYTPPAVQTARPMMQTRQASYKCPYCHSNAPPYFVEKISEAGWIVFAMMLLFCFPLFWIGLLMKDTEQFCSACRARLS